MIKKLGMQTEFNKWLKDNENKIWDIRKGDIVRINRNRRYYTKRGIVKGIEGEVLRVYANDEVYVDFKKKLDKYSLSTSQFIEKKYLERI